MTDKNATFDFIPTFCPHCGARLFGIPGNQAEVDIQAEDVDQFQAGELLICGTCGLRYRKQQEIIFPMGKPAGNPANAQQAVFELCQELGRLASAVEHKSIRIDPSLALTEAEKARGQALKDAAGGESYNLRTFEHALWLVFWQMLPPAEKADAKTKVPAKKRSRLLKDLQYYGLVLPPDLQADLQGE